MLFKHADVKGLSASSRTMAMWCMLSVIGIVGMSGCQELNRAVDSALGKGESAHAASHEVASYHQYPSNDAEKHRFSVIGQTPGGKKSTPAASKPARPASGSTSQPGKTTAQVGPELPGKKREPGAVTPETKAEEVVQVFQKGGADMFQVDRDPFRQPTEILPSECPPSMPLCKFDRSQIKLVGIIQVSGGQFKGMVEDPDGRGYFVSTGMQIGGATVTQITNKGITLHVHKSGQDVPIPLFKEGKQLREF